jgi:ribonuclease P/MRP protein subunit POP5
MWIIKDSYDEEKQIGLIRCSHTSVEEVRSAVSLIQRIGDIKVVVKVLGISGTIKGARKKFLGIRDLSYYT